MALWRRSAAAVLAVTSLVLAACGGGTPKATGRTSTTSSPVTTTTTASSGSGVAQWPGTPVADTAIPLGDGKVSSSPQVGYVDSCVNHFSGGGAQASGAWLDTAAGTWNATVKPRVEGAQSWPQATHAFTLSGTSRVLSTDDLPEGQNSGTFPIATADPAYRYDQNPNHIAAQAFSWTVPGDPQPADLPSCLGLGPIGVTTDGVVLFDALDAEGRDAGAHELQDSCGGHPQQGGVYHYHAYSSCLDSAGSDKAGSSTLVGYALDGYGIYVERDAKGNLPTDADLDVCHGRTSVVQWDGEQVSLYHYDVTVEYPYTLGCFHGTEVSTGPTPPA